MERHEIAIALPPDEARAAIASAAADWGAEWTVDAAGDGRLVLPVVFGLKRGVLVGRVEIASSGAGSRLGWRLEESRLVVQRAAVAILAATAVVLLFALAWPFHPPLLALMPFAAILGFTAWWFIVSRLRTSGPEEFFAVVAGEVDEKPR